MYEHRMHRINSVSSTCDICPSRQNLCYEKL